MRSVSASALRSSRARSSCAAFSAGTHPTAATVSDRLAQRLRLTHRRALESPPLPRLAAAAPASAAQRGTRRLHLSFAAAAVSKLGAPSKRRALRARRLPLRCARASRRAPPCAHKTPARAFGFSRAPPPPYRSAREVADPFSTGQHRALPQLRSCAASALRPAPPPRPPPPPAAARRDAASPLGGARETALTSSSLSAASARLCSSRGRGGRRQGAITDRRRPAARAGSIPARATSAPSRSRKAPPRAARARAPPPSPPPSPPAHRSPRAGSASHLARLAQRRHLLPQLGRLVATARSSGRLHAAPLAESSAAPPACLATPPPRRAPPPSSRAASACGRRSAARPSIAAAGAAAIPQAAAAAAIADADADASAAAEAASRRALLRSAPSASRHRWRRRRRRRRLRGGCGGVAASAAIPPPPSRPPGAASAAAAAAARAVPPPHAPPGAPRRAPCADAALLQQRRRSAKPPPRDLSPLGLRGPRARSLPSAAAPSRKMPPRRLAAPIRTPRLRRLDRLVALPQIRSRARLGAWPSKPSALPPALAPVAACSRASLRGSRLPPPRSVRPAATRPPPLRNSALPPRWPPRTANRRALRPAHAPPRGCAEQSTPPRDRMTCEENAARQTRRRAASRAARLRQAGHQTAWLTAATSLLRVLRCSEVGDAAAPAPPTTTMRPLAYSARTRRMARADATLDASVGSRRRICLASLRCEASCA